MLKKKDISYVIFLLSFLSLSGLAQDQSLTPKDPLNIVKKSEESLINTSYLGTWKGTYESQGQVSDIEFSFTESAYSDYEGKKNEFFKNVSEVSGLAYYTSQNKRGSQSDCKALEERRLVLIGRRFNKKVFLSHIDFEEGLPKKIFYYTIKIPEKGFKKIMQIESQFYIPALGKDELTKSVITVERK